MADDFKTMHAVTDDGWSEWQEPIMKGYRMQCCDCGLIHEVEFQVLRQMAEAGPDGTWPAEPMPDGRLSWRMRRVEATLPPPAA